MKQRSAQVVIVGGGVSGLSAAVTLMKLGFRNLTILEARDRLGGRINSLKKDGIAFEAGAQWIQKGLEKTFGKVANGNTIKFFDEPTKVAFYHEDQEAFKSCNESAIEEAFDKFCDIFDQADSKQTLLDDDDENLLTFMETNWSDCNKDLDGISPELSSQLFQNLCFSFRSYDCCDSLADLRSHSGYEKVGAECLMVEGSLSSLVKCLSDSIPSSCIKYQRRVEKITWQDENRQPHIHKRVKVLCRNKEGLVEEVAADHVIVTVPLGVLKKHHEELFSPSLPQDKIQAINRLGFGTLCKIILYYEEPFWREGTTELVFIWRNQSECNPPWWKAIVYVHLLRDQANKTPYLVIFVSGKESLELEKLDHDDVGRTCSEIFEKFMKLDKLPVPKFTHVTKWSSDPFSFGTYSYVPVGVPLGEQEILAKALPYESGALPPQVFFAGEATHSRYYSTIHGAYFSGEREAEKLSKYYL